MADTLSSAFLQQILRNTKSPVMIVFPDGKTPTIKNSKKKQNKLEESFQSQIKKLESTIRRLRKELREVKEEQQPAYTPRPPVYLMGS